MVQHLTQLEMKDSIDDLVENLGILAEFDMLLSDEDVHLSSSVGENTSHTLSKTDVEFLSTSSLVAVDPHQTTIHTNPSYELVFEQTLPTETNEANRSTSARTTNCWTTTQQKETSDQAGQGQIQQIERIVTPSPSRCVFETREYSDTVQHDDHKHIGNDIRNDEDLLLSKSGPTPTPGTTPMSSPPLPQILLESTTYSQSNEEAIQRRCVTFSMSWLRYNGIMYPCHRTIECDSAPDSVHTYIRSHNVLQNWARCTNILYFAATTL